MRLRFKLSKPLRTDAPTIEFRIGSHDCILKSAARDQKISEADWLVITAGGFASEAEGREFGQNLKAGLTIAAGQTSNGVDLGADEPTSHWGAEVQEAVRAKYGLDLRGEVHGLSVYPDDGSVLIMSMSMRGLVLADPSMFVTALAQVTTAAAQLSAQNLVALSLLNASDMAAEQIARLTLALAAIESLAKDEDWNPGQRELINRLIAEAKHAQWLDGAARAEVAEAIQKMHRVSIRQGVKRLLSRLNRSDRFKEWDKLYGERSEAVHGLKVLTNAEVSDLAQRASTLVRDLLLEAASQEAVDLRAALSKPLVVRGR